MHFSSALSLAAAVATAQAVTNGFNYGNTLSDGSFKDTATYQAEFQRAKSLTGTNAEFTSARIYTMIQGGTTSSPNQAIQAAINTGTTLLLGMWASEDQAAFDDEISALKAAISQYGSDFAKLVVGLSVGSEDLYRISPTGIENDAGVGQSPQVLVEYIKQARSAVANTVLSDVKIGHVDTWTAWVNGSNFIVTDVCDWLGVDSYPYFETTVANSIGDANSTFWQSYDNTVGAAQGKEVWVTETGWPVSGAVSGQAVASVANAETYWQEVACALLPSYNTWWYTLQDALPTVPNPSFGIVGSNLNSAPLYDLQCKKQSSGSSSSGTHHSSANHTESGSHTATGSGSHTSSGHHSVGTGYPTPNGTVTGHGGPTGAASSTGAATQPSGTGASSAASASASSTSGTASTNDAAAPKAGAAAVAGIFAIFAMVAAL